MLYLWKNKNVTNLSRAVICDVFEHSAAQNSQTSVVDTREL